MQCVNAINHALGPHLLSAWLWSFFVPNPNNLPSHGMYRFQSDNKNRKFRKKNQIRRSNREHITYISYVHGPNQTSLSRMLAITILSQSDKLTSHEKDSFNKLSMDLQKKEFSKISILSQIGINLINSKFITALKLATQPALRHRWWVYQRSTIGAGLLLPSISLIGPNFSTYSVAI